MRAIWSGAISFGLVNIPIKLFSATEQSRLDFDMLDRKDHARIHFKRVNENTGKEVTWDNIVKGYLLNDEYVILDEADFEEASPEKNKMINIQSFVKEKEIDSIYFESPYYIEPQKGGQKAYHLLVKALEKSDMAGLATFVMRTAENLCMVRAKDNLLLLNKLRFEEEIRSPEDLNIPENLKLTKAELDMALQLIKLNSTPFDIKNFKDEYKQELLKIIEQRAKGKRPKVRKLKVKSTKSDDLLAQLKASLG